MAEILKGSEVAKAIFDDLIKRSDRLRGKGIVPMLVLLRAGEHESDVAYENGAVRACKKAGIEVVKKTFPGDVAEEELLKYVDEINANSSIHGCLLFRPLPDHLSGETVYERLLPSKDVDCMTRASLTGVFTGRNEGFAPCTAQACIEILDHYNINTEGADVAVIGRSLVVGKPVSMMMQSRNATVTMCHTRTVNIENICSRAEILVVAAGKAGVVDRSYTNDGQTVIDVGINVDKDGNLHGDVDFEDVEPYVKAITPVPGGVGTVTSAVLCKHVIEAAERAAR